MSQEQPKMVTRQQLDKMSEDEINRILIEQYDLTPYVLVPYIEDGPAPADHELVDWDTFDADNPDDFLGMGGNPPPQKTKKKSVVKTDKRTATHRRNASLLMTTQYERWIETLDQKEIAAELRKLKVVVTAWDKRTWKLEQWRTALSMNIQYI